MVMTTEEIWEEFHPRIKQFILKGIPDEHNAEDILQFSRVGAPPDPVNPGRTSPHCV
jgi:hypothetical protein